MNSFQKNIRFYIILGVVALALLLVLLCLSEKITLMELMNDLLIGIFSSLVLLIFLEVRASKQDDTDYGYLAGKYKRLSRYHANDDKKVDSKWVLVDTSKDNPDIELIYKGNREYEIPKINYDIQWYAKGSITLEPSNSKRGTGVYHYTKKHESIEADFGTYELFVDSIDPDRIYIFHQNYLPSGLSIGYEIFIKQ